MSWLIECSTGGRYLTVGKYKNTLELALLRAMPLAYTSCFRLPAASERVDSLSQRCALVERLDGQVFVGQNDDSPGAGMECDALQGRLLYMRLQTICAAEKDCVLGLISEPTLPSNEVLYIRQCMRNDLVQNIVRATANKHLPREVEEAALKSRKGNTTTPLGRFALLSATWKYVSVVETAYVMLALMKATPGHYLKELEPARTLLHDALTKATDMCRALGRDQEAKLYEAQANIVMEPSTSPLLKISLMPPSGFPVSLS